MFSKKTVKERKIVKVVPYLLVYLFMKMFGYFVSGIMNGGTFISVDFFREPGAAWFILALFFMYLITFYTKQFRPAYVLIVSVFVSMAAGYSNMDTNLFCWLRIAVFYPFFYPFSCTLQRDIFWKCRLPCKSRIMDDRMECNLRFVENISEKKHYYCLRLATGSPALHSG